MLNLILHTEISQTGKTSKQSLTYCSRFSTETMSESKEADSNGFSEEFHIMSWWMVEAQGPEFCKMFISFIGDAAACLPCLVKLTKLLNSLNQNLLKSKNKKFQLWSYIYEIIICSLEDDGDLHMKLIN